MHLFVNRLGAGWIETTATGHVEIMPTSSVAAQYEVNDAALFLLRPFDEDGSRAVAKQNAGRAVLKIDDRCHDVGADDKHFFMSAGSDELCRCGEGVHESRACAGQVESPCLLCTDFRL